MQTETAKIFGAAQESGAAASSFALTDNDSVWDAIRAFFTDQATEDQV